MFFGEYTYLTDKKKGIPIPPKFLKELGGVGAEVIVAKCSDGCIYLCPSENWAKVKKELDESPYTEVIQINSKGKISLSPNLREHAGLKRRVMVVGCGDHIEFWDNERWTVAEREAEKEKIAVLGE